MHEECAHRKKKQYLFLSVVVIGGLFYLGGQYIASLPLREQKAIDANREITVNGSGEVSVRPDIAKITLGVTTGPQSSAEVAMKKLTEKINGVIGVVKKEKVKEEDIKTTGFSLNPSYDYLEGRRQLRGYEASETVTVKVRDLDNVGNILAKTTLEGVNQIGNIAFEIDDAEAAQLDAQKEAIADARGKAKELAKALGVTLGNVKTFDASSNGPQPYLARAELAADGIGGAAPEIAPGTNDVNVSVTITYELK